MVEGGAFLQQGLSSHSPLGCAVEGKEGENYPGIGEGALGRQALGSEHGPEGSGGSL